MPTRLRAALFLLPVLGFTLVAHAAEPAADLARFSVFEQFDMAKVAGGKVFAARGPALDSPRDLGIQAIYLVQAPIARVVELHRQWDPSRHSGQKVLLHTDFSTKASGADFAKLLSVPGGGAVKSLAAATQQLPEKGSLQLSTAEAGDFAKATGGGSAGAWPAAVGNFWSRLLLQRAQAFAARGTAGQAPYESGNQNVRPADEVARLLKEQPKLRTQFRGLIEATPLASGPGSLAPQLYWELFEAEGEGALALGAAYAKESGDTAQLLDLQYFSTGGYYVYVTLYQLWSVTVEGKPATLVWRGDSIASQALSELRGVEKMGSGAAMMKEVQKSIGFFQKDAAH